MRLLIFISMLLASPAALPANSLLPDLSGMTKEGLRIEIFSELSPLRINQIHSWRVRILGSNQQKLSVEELVVIGGMPEHDHGLPTQPQITSTLDNGDYLLEGVRFHMQGLWQLQIDFQFNGAAHQALIDFQLQ